MPAHDKRDFEFALKYNIPVIRVIEGEDGDREIPKEMDEVYEGEGVVFNSGFLNGFSSEEARVKMGEYIKKEKIGDIVGRYHLRDWIFSRQRYWGEPIPIIHCEKCGEVPVPYDQLPVELPKVESYEPTDTGESPLSNITQWVNTRCPKCKGPAKRETDTMPNWAGSSWYFLRYTDPHNSDKFADFSKLKYWLPVDHYEGGAEHVTLHLLYSRFWHKFLYDINLVSTKEPYQRRTIHGNVLGTDGTIMSKSKGNVINPDDLIKEYGADVVRGYMLFSGPYESDVAWSTETINGIKRFTSKYYRFLLSAWEESDQSSTEVSLAVDQLIERVERDILNFKFNTSISALMEFYNEFHNLEFSKKDIEKILICTAPIFPHLTEEVWERTGHKYSVHKESWPVVKEKVFVKAEREIPIQINGKVRGRIKILSGMSEEEIKEKVLKEGFLKGEVGNQVIKRFIYIENRVINIVI